MAAAKRKPAAKKPAAKAKKPAVKKPAAKKCGAVLNPTRRPPHCFTRTGRPRRRPRRRRSRPRSRPRSPRGPVFHCLSSRHRHILYAQAAKKSPAKPAAKPAAKKCGAASNATRPSLTGPRTGRPRRRPRRRGSRPPRRVPRSRPRRRRAPPKRRRPPRSLRPRSRPRRSPRRSDPRAARRSSCAVVSRQNPSPPTNTITTKFLWHTRVNVLYTGEGAGEGMSSATCPRSGAVTRRASARTAGTAGTPCRPPPRPRATSRSGRLAERRRVTPRVARPALRAVAARGSMAPPPTRSPSAGAAARA